MVPAKGKHAPLGEESDVSRSMELFLRTIVARAYPRVIGANREKSWIFFETLLPLLSVASTMGLGLLVLRLPIRLGDVNWPYLAASMVLGLASLAILGLLLGAATLQMARHYWSVGESVAGALYLMCGAIFPLDVLPAWLQPLGLALPLTYWLESLRRAVLGAEASTAISPSLAELGDGRLLLILLGATLVSVVISVYFFRWSDYRAREKGLIDVTTHY